MSQSRSSRSTLSSAGKPGSIRRRPHEGAGPWAPYGGRRPGRCGGRTRGPASPFAAALATVAVVAGVALLAACGGSSGGAGSPSGSASAAPTPVPSPLITSASPPAAAVAAVREFWMLAGTGRLGDAKRSLVAPGSPIQDWTGEDIASARFVRVVPRSVGGAPAKGATIEFAVDVWIEPSLAPNPWGKAREHQLFEHVVRMSDGSWRMWDSGTGP